MMLKCLGVILFIAATRAASILYEDLPEDAVYVGAPMILAPMREKRSAFPGRTMMFHGYFGSPGHPYQTSPQAYDRHNGRSYDPQGAMTAFAAGDAVSAGSSYYGNGGGYDCSNCNGAKKPANGNGIKKNGNGNGNGHGHHGNGNGNGNGNGYPQQEVPSDSANGKPENGEEEQKPENGVTYPNGNGNGNGADNDVPQENGNDSDEGYLGDQPAAEETPKGETLPPSAPTQPTAAQGPKKVPDESDEDEEDEPSYFSHKPRGRGTYYNSYFPMVFGAFPGYGGGRNGGNREDGAYNPGVATAIANSFSTGRGAVATSHATAYGGPQFVPSGSRKNGSKSRPHS